MTSERSVCSADGCDHDVRARGLCATHYATARAAGEFGGEACRFETCERTAVDRGYCFKHYRALMRRGDLVPNERCSEDGCQSASYVKGLCRRHHQSAARSGRFGVRTRVKHLFYNATRSGKCGGYSGVTTPLDDVVAHAEAWIRAGRPCALCGTRIRSGDDAMDHDHVTGAFRGFLHRQCNVAVGIAERSGAPGAFAHRLRLFLANNGNPSHDPLAPWSHRQGESNGRAKLTEGEVASIRALRASGECNVSELGRRFGVSRSAIQFILRGRNWPHAATPNAPDSRD